MLEPLKISKSAEVTAWYHPLHKNFAKNNDHVEVHSRPDLKRKLS